MMTSKKKDLILVLGGARSGKSDWALRYVEAHYASPIFLATAEVLDDEMAERVRLHKASRGPNWDLLEEPLELPEALRTHCRDHEAVLIDCLTIWLSNILLKRGEDRVEAYVDRFQAAVKERKQTIVAVSNEVGLGIVPDNPLGRKFRDLAGRLNQTMTAMADGVVFMVAGIPMVLKGES